MRISTVIIFLATLTVIQLSCKEKTMSVNKNELNDISKELGLNEDQPKVKVLSSQYFEQTIDNGSTIELEAVGANEAVINRPSSPQPSTAPLSRTNAPERTSSQSIKSTRSNTSPGSKNIGVRSTL